MRDLQSIDSFLLKELKLCCAKEYNFLPKETGLKLMESTSAEVTYFSLPLETFGFTKTQDVSIDDLHIKSCILFCDILESKWSICKMQR